MKRCSTCGLDRPTEDFSLNRTNPDGRAYRCRACVRDHYRANADAVLAYQAQYYAENRQQVLDRARAKHGLSGEDYNLLLAAQSGVCAICALPDDRGTRLAVDHDHDCCPGRYSCGLCVRGLLCRRCNLALGLLREDQEIARAVIRYLEGFAK